MPYWKTQKQPSMLCKSSRVTKAIASAFCLPTIDHTKAAQVSWSSLGKGLVTADIKNRRGQREAWYLTFLKNTAQHAHGLHSHESRGCYKGVLH